MRTNKKTLSATLLGFSMLLAACSGGGETPEALAFQDDSSGNVDVGTDDGAGDTAGTDNGAGDGAGDGAGGETTTVRPKTSAIRARSTSRSQRALSSPIRQTR